MKGITISEMARELGLARKTVEMRLLRRGHKPISYEAIYDPAAFEDIKKTPGRGRPRKRPHNNIDINQQYSDEVAGPPGDEGQKDCG